MLAKRIIPCLDVKDGRTVKGVNFTSLRDAGSVIEMASRYSDEGADELVFLDITATVEARKTMVSIVREASRVLSIPFTVGGGIKTEDDVKRILDAGADKISINSSAVRSPELIASLSSRFGSQCVVLAIDARRNPSLPSLYEVMVDGGRTKTGIDVLSWALQGEKMGAGEILLTSMEKDGTKDGFDNGITKLLSTSLSIPVIASGGAGKKEDFKKVFTQGMADAALAAYVLHYGEIGIQELKSYLRDEGISVR